MQIKLSVRHGQLSDLQQQQIRDKAEKLLHFFNRITMIEVTVDLHGSIDKEVEFVVKAEHKHDFVAREKHTDLPAAVELAYDKIVHQIHRYKEKIQDHRRDRHAGQAPEAPSADLGQ